MLRFGTRAACVLVSLGVVFAADGCGSRRKDGRVRVQGTVAVGGEPLARGTIRFAPVGAHRGPVAGGTIRDGAFSIPASAGPTAGTYEAVVTVTGPPRAKPTDRPEGSAGKAETPAETYRLPVDVTEGGATFELELTNTEPP